MTELTFIGGVSRPTPYPVTEPFRRFLAFYKTMIQFNGLVVQLASSGLLHRPDVMRPYVSFLNTSTLAAGVNNYLTYISELLTICFETQPALMQKMRAVNGGLSVVGKRGKQSSADKGAIVEKLVFRLTSHGIKELTKVLSKELEFDLYLTAEMKEKIPYYVDLRNLIVHHRGIPNHKFLRVHRNHEKDRGRLLNLHAPFIGNALLDMNSSALDLDEYAAKKFGIARPHMLKGDDG